MATPFQPLPKTGIDDDSNTMGNVEKATAPLRVFYSAVRKRRILHVEFDRTLLAVRHALLETAGFDVVSCFSGLAVREVSVSTLPFDLFLLGHAASVSDRNELVAWMRANFPQTAVVALKARDVDSSPLGDVTTVAEPEDLVKTVVEVLRRL